MGRDGAGRGGHQEGRILSESKVLGRDAALHGTEGQKLCCFDGELQMRSEGCKGAPGVGGSISPSCFSEHFAISNITVYSGRLYIDVSVMFKIRFLCEVCYPS